jgi:hypothetical protein
MAHMQQLFLADFVDMFIIYLHTDFHLANLNVSLVITFKLKVNTDFTATMLLFHVLCKSNLTVVHFKRYITTQHFRILHWHMEIWWSEGMILDSHSEGSGFILWTDLCANSSAHRFKLSLSGMFGLEPILSYRFLCWPSLTITLSLSVTESNLWVAPVSEMGYVPLSRWA